MLFAVYFLYNGIMLNFNIFYFKDVSAEYTVNLKIKYKIYTCVFINTF